MERRKGLRQLKERRAAGKELEESGLSPVSVKAAEAWALPGKARKQAVAIPLSGVFLGRSRAGRNIPSLFPEAPYSSSPA